MVVGALVCWVQVHEGSPLWGLTNEDLVHRNVEFVLIFEGVIQTTGNVLHTRTS